MKRCLAFTLLWITCFASDYYQETNYSTVAGIAAYRSVLTLDWLAYEDSRQREYAHAFENEAPVASQELENSECMEYSGPAAGKVARLMLELLKNLEGDDDIIQALGRTLVQMNLLVRTAQLEAEPDLSALVKTPQLMQGEPHVTLPRVVAVVWMLASDRETTKENGWCAIETLTEYLDSSTPSEIATRMRLVDPIIARARYIVEDFMQNVTPLKIGRQLRPVEISGSSKMKKHKKRHRFSTKPFTTDIPSLNATSSRTELIVTFDSTPETTLEVIQLVPLRTSNDVGSAGAVIYTYVFLVSYLFEI